jgi:hypothetical protein
MSPDSNTRMGATRRPALLLALCIGLLTFAAIRYNWPFTGLAALLLTFGGGGWLAVRMVRQRAAECRRRR